LKAWQKLQTFRGGAKFSTWLFGIAVNEFRGAARKRKELLLEEMEAGSTESEPSTAAADSALKLDLTAALMRLNSEERAAIVLCCQNGLSHDEAAQVLDCPLGTVKTNILRGKEKLKRCLSL